MASAIIRAGSFLDDHAIVDIDGYDIGAVEIPAASRAVNLRAIRPAFVEAVSEVADR